MGALLLGAAGIAVTAAAVAFVLDELTGEEQQKQQQIEDSYHYYREQAENQLEEIERDKQRQIQLAQAETEEERVRLRYQFQQEQAKLRQDYADHVLALLDEHRHKAEKLRDELWNVVSQIRSINRQQTSNLRAKALTQLEHNFEEGYNKAFAYIKYLDSYRFYLQRRLHVGSELPPPFSFLLPPNYPYKGKLIYQTKKEWGQQDEFTTKCGVSVRYQCSDVSRLADYHDEAVIPGFAEFPEQGCWRISLVKGLFKDNALHQPGVGFEAEVVRKDHRELTLSYRSLELRLFRKHLGNPRKMPPPGAKLRVYPLQWQYLLRRAPLVTENYEESLSTIHFERVPLVFSDKTYDEFETEMDRLGLWDAQLEWKVAPLEEATYRQTGELRLQLGTDLLLKGKICWDGLGEGRGYIRCLGLLNLERSCRPEDVFVAVNMTMAVVFEDELNLVQPQDHQVMSQFAALVLNEFKVQEQIKSSQQGIMYYNKWAEVTEGLIHYKSKDKPISCQLRGVHPVGRDKATDLPMHLASVINVDEVKEYLESETRYGRSDYTLVDADGSEHIAEFTPNCEQVRIFGELTGELATERDRFFNLARRIVAYPEIQQVKALNEFRAGNLENPVLKPYLLNGGNVESKYTDLPDPVFHNSNIGDNRFQKEAVIHALAEPEFFMIQGPPGTGKTTVIKEILFQHLERNPHHRVLVVSQANVAVDNVLRGLVDEAKTLFSEADLVRCGQLSRIERDMHRFTFENRYEEYIQSVNQVAVSDENQEYLDRWRSFLRSEYDGSINSDVGELLLKNHRIVGATCVGLAQKRIGLDRLKFDLVIIDESSKALPAEILIPVLRAHKVILIGDHKQLPPTVDASLYDPEKVDYTDREYCQNELFTTSLFERLYEHCPDSNKRMLRTQYRMPAVLGNLISELFYGGDLENGPNTYEKEFPYFKAALNWLDMSYDVTYKENSENGRSPHNPREAEVVSKVVKGIRNKMPTERIAIITPYKGQLRELRSRFDLEHPEWRSHTAINTVDAFQGDEADVVIFCTTRSQTQTAFFSDRARLNVAFSRARRELLIIGSLDYFADYGEENAVFHVANYVKQHGRIWGRELFSGETP